jgi:hypothetical protein
MIVTEREAVMNDESVKWVEEQVALVQEFQERCTTSLEQQANGLLTVLLAGAGGAFGFAVNLIDKAAQFQLQMAMIATAFWLFIVAAILLATALWSQSIYGPGNDPDSLSAAHGMPTAKPGFSNCKTHSSLSPQTANAICHAETG